MVAKLRHVNFVLFFLEHPIHTLMNRCNIAVTGTRKIARTVHAKKYLGVQTISPSLEKFDTVLKHSL